MRGSDLHSRVVLLLGFIVLFVGGGSRFSIGLLLKPMAEDLGWSRSALGAAAALFLILSAAFMFVSGRLVDRYSARTILGTGLVIAAAGIAFMGAVDEPWQALLAYGVIFAAGNGIASITPVGVMISRWFPGRMGIANAAATAGTGFGQVVIIGGLAAVLTFIGWRSSFWLLGLVNLVVAPVVFFGLRSYAAAPKPHDTLAPASHDLGLAEAAKTGRFWLLLAVYAICGFQDFFVSTHVVAFAQDNLLDTLVAGNLLAFMGLTGVVGVMAAGIWADRKGPKQATVFSFALRTILFALVLFLRDPLFIAIFALLFGVTFWMTAPLTVIFVRNAFGIAHLGSISGLIVMVHHMCGGLGALLGAALFDHQGNYDAAFALMLAVSAAATVLSIRLRE